MSERKAKFVFGENYHIYNRGNSKMQIFHDVQDYERFRKILFLANGIKQFKYKELIKSNKNPYSFERGEGLVDIYAYVMMPNHFHLFLTPRKARGNIRTDRNLETEVSVFMKRLTTAYSRYYNQKYNRSGGLFEGKFKAEHVTDSNYFKYLFSYIHLNPVKLIQKDWKEIGISDFGKTRKFLLEYKHSSFLDYFAENEEGSSKIINKKSFLEKLPLGTNFARDIFEWLKFKTIT